MIVLIFMSGEDTKHTATLHLRYGMIRVASPVFELVGKSLDKTKLLVLLSKDQQASIYGNIFIDRLHSKGYIGQKIEGDLPNIVSIQIESPNVKEGPYEITS